MQCQKFFFVLEPVESVDFVKRYEDKFPTMAATILRLCESSGLFGTPRVLVGDSAFPSLPVIEKLKKDKIHTIFALKKKKGWTRGVPGDVLLQKTNELEIGKNSISLIKEISNGRHVFMRNYIEYRYRSIQ